jgi:hypothetical protein
MSVQTTYKRYSVGPIPGVDADQNTGYKVEGQNKTGVDLSVGVGVCQHSSVDSGVVLPAAKTDKVLGIVLNDQGRNPNGATTGAWKADRMAPMKVEGPAYVAIDQDVTPRDDVYIRYAASGNAQTGEVGSFRKDGDGVAQVVTLTPTAANSTPYRVTAHGDGKAMTFETTSDGSATATEICDALRTLMLANPDFAAQFTLPASGAATLVITSRRQNEAFGIDTSGAAGVIAAVVTTSPSGTARRMRGQRWLASGTAAAGAAPLYFSAAQESR